MTPHDPARTAFRRLPLGSIRPRGWLHEQLRLQADGLTGSLEEVWADVGPNSAWLGGSGEGWERGPYYLDGLVPLAHLLEDGALLAKARRWIEAILTSQRQNGQFGPAEDLDWWPRMVALKVLIQHFEATGDSRVLPFMERYFRHQLEELPCYPLEHWGWARAAENLLPIAWLYARRPDPALLELAELLAQQGLDWGGRLADDPPRGITKSFDHFRHVVNVAMGFKLPAVRYALDGDPEHLRRLRRALRNVDRYHGQVNGMFSGDEWLAGRAPSHGVELCAVVEFMFTLETLIEIVGDGAYGDRLEEVAYNSLAATMTADLRAHQYHQQPNQVSCTIAPRHWTFSSDEANIFGLEPHYGCCTANMHQGWPKLASSLWMETLDGGLAAIAHAPCRVETATCVLEVETDYPFSGTIAIRVGLDAPSSFPIQLRIPSWCDHPRLVVAGEPQEIEVEQGFVRVLREWRDGDMIELALPSEPRLIRRSRSAVGVALGPLVLALPIGEDWQRIPDRPGFGDWEVRPTTPWNYGLAVNGNTTPSNSRVVLRGVPSPPFSAPALHVELNGRRVDNWRVQRNSAGPIPSRPSVDPRPPEPLKLVPYGAARLRITEFPWLQEGEEER